MKDGRRGKGKSHTGKGTETLENGPFVGFDTGCGGLVWFLGFYCSKPPAQLAARSAPCCGCVRGEGGFAELVDRTFRPRTLRPSCIVCPVAGAPPSCRSPEDQHPRREQLPSLPACELYGPSEGRWIP